MFVQALLIGMTHDQFWYGEPRLFFVYLRAYEEKTKNDMDRIDYTSWLVGAYVNYALNINHPFAKKREKYLEHPFSYNEPDEVRKLTEKEKEEVELKKAELQFNQFAKYVATYNEQYFNK